MEDVQENIWGIRERKNKLIREGPNSFIVSLFTVYLFFVLKDSGSTGLCHLLLIQRRSAVTFWGISVLDPDRAHAINLILKFIIRRRISFNPGFNSVQ